MLGNNLVTATQGKLILGWCVKELELCNVPCCLVEGFFFTHPSMLLYFQHFWQLPEGMKEITTPVFAADIAAECVFPPLLVKYFCCRQK